MSIPELVTIHTSLLTDLGDAVRERFALSGELTIEEMTEIVKLSLPSGYTRVEYIESSGTQYIATGIVVSSSTKIIARIEATSKNDGGFFGLLSERGKLAYGYGFVNEKVEIAFGNPYALYETTLNADLDLHTVEFTNGSQKIDGIEIATYSANDFSVYPSSTKLALFAEYANWGSNFGSVRFYNCQIYNESAVVRSFVPCTRDSDGVAGMYDIINGQFYTNAGTGTFITP